MFVTKLLEYDIILEFKVFNSNSKVFTFEYTNNPVSFDNKGCSAWMCAFIAVILLLISVLYCMYWVFKTVILVAIVFFDKMLLLEIFKATIKFFGLK